jgi:hypothetical protein
MVMGLDVIEVLIGMLMLLYTAMLVHMIDFNDKVINNDRPRTKETKE